MPTTRLAKKKLRVLGPDREGIIAQATAVTPDQMVGIIMSQTVGYTSEGKRPLPRVPFHGKPRGSAAHPNALAALEMHRWKSTWKPGQSQITPTWPRCQKASKRRNGEQCHKAAVRGAKFCYAHGGRAQRERNLRETYADYRPARVSVASRLIRQLALGGRIPFALVQDVPQFREAYQRARHGVSFQDPRFATWTYAQRRLHFEACSILVLRFVGAWELVSQHADFTLWQDCVREADRLGL